MSALAQARATADAAAQNLVALALRAGRTADAVDLARLNSAELQMETALNELVQAAENSAMEPVTLLDHLSALRARYDAGAGQVA